MSTKKDLIMHEFKLMTQEEYRKHQEEVQAKITDRVISEQNCFIENAFLFYAASERILRDRALFFVPVPFNNNLAYSGTSGFRNATLGVYVKWWQTYKQSLVFAKSGFCSSKTEPRLLYFLAGSPLSGMNHCSVVNLKGESFRYTVPGPFYNAWRPFMQINQSYTNEFKASYRKYTLCDVARMLREDAALMAHYETVLRNLENGVGYEVEVPQEMFTEA